MTNRIRACITILALVVACLGFTTYLTGRSIAAQEETIAILQARLVEVEGRANQALAAVDLDAQYGEIVRVVAMKAAHLEPIQVVEIAQAVQEQSILYSDDGITPSLLLALMERESTFNPIAVSPMQASGLMQVIESTALIHLERFGYTEWEHVRFIPSINIKVGVAELVRLRRGYVNEGVETPGDSWTYTLHSYRWGPRNTRLLMNAREKRVEVPSLEYSVGVRALQLAYMNGGLN
jgi:hypothetical protein